MTNTVALKGFAGLYVLCAALIIISAIGLIPMKTEMVNINYPGRVVTGYISYRQSPHRRLESTYISPANIHRKITLRTLFYGNTNRDEQIRKAIKDYELEQLERIVK